MLFYRPIDKFKMLCMLRISPIIEWDGSDQPLDRMTDLRSFALFLAAQ